MTDVATWLHERWMKLEEERGYGDPDYDDLVATMNVEVVSRESFGQYQGDLVYHVRRDGTDGILIIGFGSCSGCDALQAATPWTPENPDDWRNVVALRDRLEAGILWPADGSMVKRLEAREQEDWWYYGEDGLREYVQELAREIDAAA